MSQVTEQSVRFQTALASIKLIQASAVLDLTEDDFDFLTSNKVWIATDRSRARDRKSGSAGMPRPISYAVFCLKKKKTVLGGVLVTDRAGAAQLEQRLVHALHAGLTAGTDDRHDHVL